MKTQPGLAKDHSTNLVGIATGLLASTAFNDYPLPLEISGVREMNRPFFEKLGQAPSATEAGVMFEHYMALLFGLDGGALVGDEGAGKRRFRSSYLRLLQGWGFDSNGAEGAVLKGWVESRFGLLPNFHKETLQRFPAPAWITYVEEKMSSRFHNSISLQLDILYGFCQWMLARWLMPGKKHVTLYRGVNGLAEHQIVERIDKRTAVIRQNNLVSFTSDRLRADEFGDTILEAQVPLVKVLFFNELLAKHPLKGEGEYLVIGGDYRVKVSYF